MGLSELFSDLYAALGVGEAVAEAPSKDDDSSGGSEAKDGDAGEEKEDEDEDKEGEDKEGDKNEAEGGEEDEEEDDEPVDPKPKLEEECANSTDCQPAKHHFDACAARVRAAEESPHAKGHKEDCVEEFFHLQHCATNCAAPKLFRLLK